LAYEYKTGKGEYAVEQKQFESELIAAKELCGIDFKKIAYHRAYNGNNRHPAVAHTPLGEQAKGIQAEERAVGVAGDIEQYVNQRVVMKWTESYNHQQIKDCKTDMHHLAIAHLILLVEALALVEMEEIIAERCRQRRQCAVGATVACSDHAKNEAHEGEATHRLRYHRIYLVAQHTSVGT